LEQDDDDIFNLSKEELKLIDNVVHPEKMSLEEALHGDDPLGDINNNLSGKSKCQKEFRVLYAAILEINSDGVPGLFDHFTERELETIYRRYNALTARKLCSAIDTLKKLINERLGAKASKKRISEFFNSTRIPDEVKNIYKDNKRIVVEMEKKLLAYATSSLEDLKD
jgi:hypothetical protein